MTLMVVKLEAVLRYCGRRCCRQYMEDKRLPGGSESMFRLRGIRSETL